MARKYIFAIFLLFIQNVTGSELEDDKEEAKRCQNLAKAKKLQENDKNGEFLLLGWHEDVEVKLGGTAKFRCNHIGYRGENPAFSPPVELYWFHNNKKLIPNEKVHISGCREKPFIPGTRLFLTNVTNEDVGQYSCRLWLSGEVGKTPSILREDIQLSIRGQEIMSTRTMSIAINGNNSDSRSKHPTTQGSPDSSKRDDIIYAVVITTAILVVVLPTIMCCCKGSRARGKPCIQYVCKVLRLPVPKNLQNDNEMTIYYDPGLPDADSFQITSESDLEAVCKNYTSVFPFLTNDDIKDIFKLEIKRARLQCDLQHSMPIILGTGNFGQVYAGTVNANGSVTHVAVKRLNDGYSTDELGNFLREVKTLMRAGKHVNIISLVGTIVLDTLEGTNLGAGAKVQRPPILVMELATGGNLRKYLHDNRFNFTLYRDLKHDDEDDTTVLDLECLVSFGSQVARGMEHLASKNILHRDLAARNILLTDKLVAKIADFGLSKFMTEDKKYYRVNSRGITPAKWTAPESLYTSKFTVKSDVWSYGVLLWEILTLGDQPYASVPACKLYEYLTTGNRLKRPSLASYDLYEIMLSCWSWNPTARPTFTTLAEKMGQILLATSSKSFMDFSSSNIRLSGSSNMRDSGLSCGNSSITESTFDSRSEATFSAISSDTYTSNETVIAAEETSSQVRNSGIVYEIMNPLYENNSSEDAEKSSPEYVNEIKDFV